MQSLMDQRILSIISREIKESEYEQDMKTAYKEDPVAFIESYNRISETQQKNLRDLYAKEKEIRERHLRQAFNGISPYLLKSIYAASQIYAVPLRSCVYFIKNKRSGLTKIGMAENIEKRFPQIKSAFAMVGMPAKLSLEGLVLVYPRYLSKIESDFHNIFKSKQAFGEWFKLSEDDLYEKLYQYTDQVETICNIPVNYMDYEYFHFPKIEKDYNISIEELGYSDKLHGLRDPLLNMFVKSNKLFEIMKSVEKHKVGFYDIVLDEHDYSKVHGRGIKHADSDEWYNFQEVKTKAFNKQYWEQTIKKINKQ